MSPATSEVTVMSGVVRAAPSPCFQTLLLPSSPIPLGCPPPAQPAAQSPTLPAASSGSTVWPQTGSSSLEAGTTPPHGAHLSPLPPYIPKHLRQCQAQSRCLVSAGGNQSLALQGKMWEIYKNNVGTLRSLIQNIPRPEIPKESTLFGSCESSLNYFKCGSLSTCCEQGSRLGTGQ